MEGELGSMRILDARVYIFVLGRHRGFGNCGGLGRGNISRLYPAFRSKITHALQARAGGGFHVPLIIEDLIFLPCSL